MPWALSSRPKISHLTIHFKVIVIIVRFDLSSFTYAIIFFLNPYWSSNFVRFVVKF